MPLKLNVGLSKKIGRPDYGSLGANCNVELELAASLLQQDPQAFQQQVRNAFAACRQAVEDGLTRDRGTADASNRQAAAALEPTENGQTNGRSNRRTGTGNGHRASQKQIEYAQQLAGQIKGFGVRRLESLAGKMFDKPLADLSSLDASGLIDMLKSIKEGKIKMGDALKGAAE
jgi:hypothetical protein